MNPDAFRVSRIYGEGWKAAKQLVADRAVRLDPHRAATLNPYREFEERARWSKGFEEGLRSSTGARGGSNLRSWRPHKS